MARCIFAQKSHFVEELTRQRYERRYHGEGISEHAVFGDGQRSTHGMATVISDETQQEEPEAFFQDIVNSISLPTSRFDENYVQRLGLCEIRVMTLRINSFAFRNSLQKVRQY